MNTITPHPDAPLGEVISLDRYDASTFSVPCLVCCRNTAPLVSLAYSLLQRDVPVTILGRDIGAALAGVVKKMRATDIDNLLLKLGDWHVREISRAESTGRNPERVEDQYTCLVFFIRSLDSDSQTIPDLLAKIDLMFSEETSNTKVVLSTIHRAKGLEYPLVFILDRSLLPSRYAKLPWQREQERNLHYVAVTRAMERLVYINSDCWKEEKPTL